MQGTSLIVEGGYTLVACGACREDSCAEGSVVAAALVQ